MKRRQTGFTLIELVMVIVMLGVLSATALPRLANLSGDAEESVFAAVRSNFQTAVKLVYSKSVIHRTDGNFPDVLLGGECVNVNPTSGYPTVDQPAGSCAAVAYLLPIRNRFLPKGWVEQWAERFEFPALLVTLAVAGAPPPPPPPSSATLPELLVDGDFSDWVWLTTAPTATLTTPGGLSFSYNQNSGNVD